MKNLTPLSIILLSLASLTVSCSREGWIVDYGKPEAQFLEEDLSSKGEEFLKKKVTVKGTVAKVDISDPEASWIQLSKGTKCYLGHLHVMAESCEVGEEVYINGILKRNKDDELVLDPAIVGDPKMKFEPGE